MSDDTQDNSAATPPSADAPAGKKGAHVVPELCIGCTLCTQICPDVFEMQDDGKSKAVNPTGDTEDKIQQSIDACPVDAIVWKESNESNE